VDVNHGKRVCVYHCCYINENVGLNEIIITLLCIKFLHDDAYLVLPEQLEALHAVEFPTFCRVKINNPRVLGRSRNIKEGES
jgi:hypothetical protein